jgi:aspartokinase-like uncharacterized kinase
MGNARIIVKVGGSLFDLPDLRHRLRAFLSQLGEAKILFVPGGGATADAIRAFDAVHQVGEEAAHWLAIRALSLNAGLLHGLLPEARIVAEIPGTVAKHMPRASALASGATGVCQRWYILDPFPFFREDERRDDHLPHDWHVTSDSLAVRVATLANAADLLLLKSTAWSGSNWTDAAEAGIVDSYFARALRQAPASLRIRLVNFRAND